VEYIVSEFEHIHTCTLSQLHYSVKVSST